MARTTPVLLTELSAFLQDAEPELRAQAAHLLGEARHAPSAPLLLPLLAQPQPRVQMMAALALSRMGEPAAVGPLFTLVQSNDDQDPVVRHAAVMGLAACAKAGELVALAKDHPSTAVRLAAVLALRQLEAPEIASFLQDAAPQIATEAARAIYDRQITPAFPALALMLERTTWADGWANEGLLRRAIEANVRLGTAEHAQRIAKLATLPKEAALPDEDRLMAFEALQRWDAPGDREGVWGRWAPLPAREAGMARPTIKALVPPFLKVSEGVVLNKAREIDHLFGEEKSPDQLLALAKDDSHPWTLRIDYLKTLEARGHAALTQTEDACRAILANHAAAPRLRVEARALLVKHAPGSALAMFNEALVTGSTLEKQEAVLGIAKLRTNDTDKRIQELGTALLMGTLDPVIQVEVLEAIRHRDEKRSGWRRILERYDAKMDEGGDLLAAHRVALQGGDAAAGQAVFQNNQSAQCLRCHAVGGHGGIVGPELKGLNTRHPDANYLLESLVNPSAKVVDGYGIVSVTMKDGKVLGGVLQQQSATQITLREGTTARVIARTDISEITPPMSGMPPMAALLTQRELRDLIAYLQTLL